MDDATKRVAQEIGRELGGTIRGIAREVAREEIKRMGADRAPADVQALITKWRRRAASIQNDSHVYELSNCADELEALIARLGRDDGRHVG